MSGYYPQQAYYAPGWGPPPPPRRRLWPWVAGGVVLVLLATAGVVALAAQVARVSATQPLGDVRSPTTAHVRALGDGHCVAELPADGRVARVRVVPCDRPHEAEVLGVLVLTDDAWPGAGEVEQRAAAACEMDRRQSADGWVPVVWTPSEAGWSQGDRRALCVAASTTGPAVGSWTEGGPVVVGG